MNNMSKNGYFGEFGGKFVAEILRAPLDELEIAFKESLVDSSFQNELQDLQINYIGRPTPLLFAKNITEKIGGAKIYIKMEGLANTGAHKINNAIGQVLLAKKMGKTRIIAETGAGQHGLATAAACAKLKMECEIYMGEVDIARQQPNVYTMEMYGAKVNAVASGSKTLKDAINEAMRDWATNFKNTHYLVGSVLGPAPFPDIVRAFQSIIGEEVKKEIEKKSLDIEALCACVGGGSNAIGFFAPFIENKNIKLIAAEAGGIGRDIGQNAVRMNGIAKESIVQGYKSKFLLDDDGQVEKTYSISAGLDYPGIGPQLAHLGKEGRIKFYSINDKEALEALNLFAKHEGILFALESAHAGAIALEIAKNSDRNKAIIINMSGRGDKDIFITSPIFRKKEWEKFLKNELDRLNHGIEIHNYKAK